MMAKETIPALRKTKTKLTEVDIRPLILSIRGEGNHLFTTLVLNEKESCKPQMLLEALKEAAPGRFLNPLRKLRMPVWQTRADS